MAFFRRGAPACEYCGCGISNVYCPGRHNGRFVEAYKGGQWMHLTCLARWQEQTQQREGIAAASEAHLRAVVRERSDA